MSALWLMLRTSPIRLTLPILTALDLAVLFLRNRYWIGVWPETGAAAQVPAYLIGVVAAGAAAWAASAPTRHRLDEQLKASRIHPAKAEAYRLGATVIIVLIPYLVGQAVAFGLTARTFPPGVHLWLGYLLLGVFVILSAVVLGWMCGRLLGPVFAAFTAALGFMFLGTLLDKLANFIVTTGRPEVAVDPLPLALRLGSVLAVLATLEWLPTAATLSRDQWKAFLLLPALLSLAVVTVATDAVVDRQPIGDKAVCVQGSTTLCIWPEHEKYLPQFRTLNARIDALPDAFIAPPRINEVGLQKTWYRGADGEMYWGYEEGPPIFYVLDGSPWSYAGDIRNAIMASTLGFQDAQTCNWQTLTSSDRGRLSAVDAWLEAYLIDQVTPDYLTNAPAEMQEAWSRGRAVASKESLADQFRWAEQEVSYLREHYCRSGH